jgi:hypothetical protein
MGGHLLYEDAASPLGQQREGLAETVGVTPDAGVAHVIARNR